MSGFDRWFADIDTEEWAAQFAAVPVVGRAVVVPAGEGLFNEPAVTIEVTDELLMDYGIIPDTRPPAVPPSRWTLLRWKLPAWRRQAARRAYRIIAGDWPDDGEDD
jgi:hypothetical protein